MSVALGDLIPADSEFAEVEVVSSDYSANWLRLLQDDEEIVMDYRQLMVLSKIIDRFLDK